MCLFLPRIEGLADWTDTVFKKLGIMTVGDLATWKYFLRAEALVELAGREIEGGRATTSKLNVNNALDKAYEKKSFKEVVQLPPSALQGIAEHTDDDLKRLRIHTIEDLGKWKYAKWASAIMICAKLEEDV